MVAPRQTEPEEPFEEKGVPDNGDGTTGFLGNWRGYSEPTVSTGRQLGAPKNFPNVGKKAPASARDAGWGGRNLQEVPPRRLRQLDESKEEVRC